MNLLGRLAGAGLAIAVAAVFGRFLLRPAEPGLSRAERWAWGLAGGLAAVAALDALLLAARIGSSPWALRAAVLAAAAAAGVVLRRRASSEGHGSRRTGWLGRALWLAGGAAVLLFAVEAVSEPMWATDYLAIWGFKGKTIWATASVPGRLFHDVATEWSHPEYPLLLPLALASLSSLKGSWDSQSLALVYPALQLATALAAAGFLSRRRRPIAGAVGFFLVASFFPLYRAFHTGMAEIPFALALLLAATAFLDLRESAGRPALARAALASLLCAATKQEGAVWVGLLAVALLLNGRGRARGRVVGALCLAGPAIAHAIALRLARGPLADRDFDLGLLSPARLSELLARFGELGGVLLRRAVLPMALPLSLAAVFFLVSRRGGAEALLPPLAGQIAVYALALAFCRYGEVWLLETSFDRIASALFPTAAVVLAARLDATWAASGADRAATHRMEGA